MGMNSLANHFLIAMPSLMDPNFHRSVTYICEHDENGAMGIVINRPMGVQLIEVLAQMDIVPVNDRIGATEVFTGGPVQQNRGFVLHSPTGQWESMLQITDEIAITTSKDILVDISEGQGPADCLITLGYAGWGPGQLEAEMTANDWLSGPANAQILFNVGIEERWKAAAALLGVDLDLLSDEVGHS
ncbi:MAG: YqgE/AlgH family protein [Gammaproteobacteria bacterium]|nr:MAG: YqgE/AlgH family protein [Gammaproteobacteria bacterium]